MKLFKVIVSLFAIVFAMIALTVWFLVQGSLPTLDGNVDVNDHYPLSHSTRLERDALGMVTVFAANRNDANFAIGFAHGQDRFFQLDLQRRYAAGELSQLFGAVALDQDKSMRLHNFRRVAEAAVANLQPQDLALLEAYTQGVNSGMASLSVRPFEYLLTRQAPQPWKNEDSLLVSIFMFAQMTAVTQSRDYARELLFSAGGDELLSFIQPQGTLWDSAIDGTKGSLAVLPPHQLFTLNSKSSKSEEVLSSEEPLNGSNSWAVSGALTSDGKALLANDPHLALSLPHIWYRTQLNYVVNNKNIQVTGVGLPGLPGVAIGSNTNIAWGMTNSAGDWADLIELDIKDDHYETRDGLAALTSRIEVIKVAGGEDVIFEVKESKWGPVVDLEDGRSAAVRWLPQFASAINAFPFLGLAEIEDVESAIKVAQDSGISPFNFLVADAAGNIGWTIAGVMPQRGNVRSDRVIHWSDANEDWNHWLSSDQYPEVINPLNHYIWTANNRIIGGEELHKIGDGQYELGARAWLIEQDLKRHSEFDEAIMAEMMMNDRAVMLDIWQAHLVSLLERQSALTTDQQTALQLATNWSASADKEDAGYTLVREYRRQFAIVLNDSVIEELKDRGVLPESTSDQSILSRQSEGAMRFLIEQEPMAWLEAEYISWDELYLDVLNRAIAYLTKNYGSLQEATWGNANRLDMVHPMSRALPSVLAKYLKMPATPQNGDAHMPLVARPTHGQSMRFIVSPGDEVDGYLVIPGGQSGHPMSPFFSAGHQDWVEDKRTNLLPGPALYKLQLQ